MVINEVLIAGVVLAVDGWVTIDVVVAGVVIAVDGWVAIDVLVADVVIVVVVLGRFSQDSPGERCRKDQD